MKVEFNLNNYIWVKLTPEGFNHLYNYWKPYSKETLEYYQKDIDDKGYTKMQAWSFMEIFGPVTHLGGTNHFHLTILLDIKDLQDA